MVPLSYISIVISVVLTVMVCTSSFCRSLSTGGTIVRSLGRGISFLPGSVPARDGDVVFNSSALVPAPFIGCAGGGVVCWAIGGPGFLILGFAVAMVFGLEVVVV